MARLPATPPWTWCACLAVVGACAVDDSTDWVEPRTALDRPGVYRSGLNVRVIDDRGRPVEATVSVDGPWAGIGRDRRRATTTANEDGYAEIRDVSSTRSLYVSVEPPQRLRPITLPLEGVTNGIADLGVLRLQRNVVITGTVKRVGDGGSSTAVDKGSVSLYAVGDGERLGFANVRDGSFRLDDFDIEPMEIEFDDRVSRTPDLRARLPIDPERDRQHFDVFVDRSVLRIESRDVPPELASVVVERRGRRGRESTPAEAPTHRIDLRFVDSEGEPITSAQVGVVGNPRVPAAITDADGRVSMATVAAPERLYLAGHWGAAVHVGIESPKDRELAMMGPPDVVADVTGRSEIAIPIQRRVEVEVSGIDPRELVYSVGWLGRQWRTVDQTLIERVFVDSTWQNLLRAEAPGRLPRFAAYPVPERLEFDFHEDKQHVLVVVDEGGPIADATVDLVEVATQYLDRVAVNDPEADIFLGSLTTGAGGRLARLGDPGALYVAYVYADGYEPARVLLQAGSETRVELVRRDVRVDFTGLSAGELLRVKVAGGDSLVVLHRTVDASDIVVSLAPGTYDATVESPEAVIDRGTTFVVGQEPRVVDTSLDRRPEVVLRLPDLPVVPEENRTDAEAAAPPLDRWTAWASRRTAAGRPFRATTYFGEPIGGERPAEIDSRAEPGEMAQTLRLSGSGRWLVYLAAERRSVPHLYFVEVELAAGEKREIPMPPLDASLNGAFERNLVAYHHGVAGPRMMMIRAAGAEAGWNVVNQLPREVILTGAVDVERGIFQGPADGPGHHDFAMRDLPAGDYHLFHHLGEDSAWGGIELSLRNGVATRVPRLGSAEAGPWTVEVVDSEGRLVRDQVLRIRDRMHEAWEASHSEPFRTGGYPADALPLPPAARLNGEPVTFASIRPGWIELVLDDPTGPARHYRRKVVPGSTLTLVVDD